MSDTKTLKAEPRSVIRKKIAVLRREGLTPMVVYGPGIEPAHLQTKTKELILALRKAKLGDAYTIEVAGEAAPRQVHLKAIQQHVTKLTPLHLDFVQH